MRPLPSVRATLKGSSYSYSNFLGRKGTELLVRLTSHPRRRPRQGQSILGLDRAKNGFSRGRT